MEICQTTRQDLPTITWLFDQAMQLRGENGYITWQAIDKQTLIADIEQQIQYKIVQHKAVAAIFTIQHNDRFIWRHRDTDNAIYIHRAVTHPDFKGQRLFEKTLRWVKHYARNHHRTVVRLDTISSNGQLIKYYQSFGFKIVETYRTPNNPDMPLQNRAVQLTLMELLLS